jgi:hypothetical protein
VRNLANSPQNPVVVSGQLMASVPHPIPERPPAERPD